MFRTGLHNPLPVAILKCAYKVTRYLLVGYLVGYLLRVELLTILLGK